jgi:peptide/nickel transport system substrate-binding protein
MAKARAALREAGYRGEPVVLMVPSTSSTSSVMGAVAADTLKQDRHDREVYAVEFNAMLQRRNRKGRWRKAGGAPSLPTGPAPIG